MSVWDGTVPDRAPRHRPLRGSVQRPARSDPAGRAATPRVQGGRVRHGSCGHGRLQAAELDDAADGRRAARRAARARRRPQAAKATSGSKSSSARCSATSATSSATAASSRRRASRRSCRRRSRPADVARRGTPPRPPRVADRYRARRSRLPRRGGRLGGGRGEARRDDRGGRAADPLRPTPAARSGASDCRGLLAAQQLKPQARVLAEARGFDCVEVDLELVRGAAEPTLSLF